MSRSHWWRASRVSRHSTPTSIQSFAHFDSDSQCWCNVTLCQRWCKKQLLTAISGLDGFPIWISTLWQLFVEFLQKVRINCCVLIFVEKMKTFEQLKKHPISPTQPSISRRLQPWELNLFYNLLMVVHGSLHHQQLFKTPTFICSADHLGHWVCLNCYS